MWPGRTVSQPLESLLLVAVTPLVKGRPADPVVPAGRATWSREPCTRACTGSRGNWVPRLLIGHRRVRGTTSIQMPTTSILSDSEHSRRKTSYAAQRAWSRSTVSRKWKWISSNRPSRSGDRPQRSPERSAVGPTNCRLRQSVCGVLWKIEPKIEPLMIPRLKNSSAAAGPLRPGALLENQTQRVSFEGRRRRGRVLDRRASEPHEQHRWECQRATRLQDPRVSRKGRPRTVERAPSPTNHRR